MLYFLAFLWQMYSHYEKAIMLVNQLPAIFSIAYNLRIYFFHKKNIFSSEKRFLVGIASFHVIVQNSFGLQYEEGDVWNTPSQVVKLFHLGDIASHLLGCAHSDCFLSIKTVFKRTLYYDIYFSNLIEPPITELPLFATYAQAVLKVVKITKEQFARRKWFSYHQWMC